VTPILEHIRWKREAGLTDNTAKQGAGHLPRGGGVEAWGPGHRKRIERRERGPPSFADARRRTQDRAVFHESENLACSENKNPIDSRHRTTDWVRGQGKHEVQIGGSELALGSMADRDLLGESTKKQDRSCWALCSTTERSTLATLGFLHEDEPEHEAPKNRPKTRDKKIEADNHEQLGMKQDYTIQI
jgi:hypothetical protein